MHKYIKMAKKKSIQNSHFILKKINVNLFSIGPKYFTLTEITNTFTVN